MHLPEVSQGQASSYILPVFPSSRISEAHETAQMCCLQRNEYTHVKDKNDQNQDVFLRTPRSFHVLMTIVDWLHSITAKTVNIIIRFTGFSGLHQSIMGEITWTKVVLTNRPQQVRSGHT